MPSRVPKWQTKQFEPVLATPHHLALYTWNKEKSGMVHCTGACAKAWPPVTVANAQVPAGLDPKLFSVIDRSDGTHQLKAGKWPLYRFAGDAAAGDVNGQGSGGVWFVVKPDGSLNKG